eukprot:4482376-Prymnesium_polylepis.1
MRCGSGVGRSPAEGVERPRPSGTARCCGLRWPEGVDVDSGCIGVASAAGQRPWPAAAVERAGERSGGECSPAMRPTLGGDAGDTEGVCRGAGDASRP